jgi:hypothetical protein
LDALISDFRRDCAVPFNFSIVQASDGSVGLASSQDWESQRRYMTHAGYRVRSKAEKIITDFLTASDLAFVYEPQVKIGNLFVRPDFYFPEYGLLYEHFGLNTLTYLQSAEAKIKSYNQAVSAVTTNRPVRVEMNQPAILRKFTFSFQKTPCNALLRSFLQ